MSKSTRSGGARAPSVQGRSSHRPGQETPPPGGPRGPRGRERRAAPPKTLRGRLRLLSRELACIAAARPHDRELADLAARAAALEPPPSPLSRTDQVRRRHDLADNVRALIESLATVRESLFELEEYGLRATTRQRLELSGEALSVVTSRVDRSTKNVAWAERSAVAVIDRLPGYRPFGCSLAQYAHADEIMGRTARTLRAVGVEP